MEFGRTNYAEKIGEKAGFVIMYFIFTAILCLILKLLNKFPSSGYPGVINITLLITLAGVLLKFLLK